MAMHPPGPPAEMMGGGGVPVDVAEVQEKEVLMWHEFSGRLTAFEQAVVQPRVGGQVETIHFKNGAMVKKGDILYTLDQRPYRTELEQMEAAYSSAEASAKLSRTEFARAEALFKDKAVSQREYDTRQNAQNVAEAGLKSAAAALDRAKLDMDYTEVKAPIDGRVGRAEVTVGNMVQAGNAGMATMLTMIVSEDPIYADFEMDEVTYLQYARQKEGEAPIPVKLGLSSEKDTPHEGRIESFDNKLDAGSGTIRVRAVFDNADGKLVPGLFARIRIGGDAKEKALLINDRAIGTDQDKKFVLVLGENNMLQYRPVRIGGPAEGLRVVTEGLQPGDKIVISGLNMKVHPGMPATPNVVPMDAPASAPPAEQGAPPAEAPPAEAPKEGEGKSQ
jgi:multidrug efflux system membrane fusion protein